MNWNDSTLAILGLKRRFSELPARTKDNLLEYEALAIPLRKEAIALNSIRVNLCINKLYV